MSRWLIATLVVVCLLGSSKPLQAQSVGGGVKAGVTSSRMSGAKDAINAPVDEEGRAGFTAGAFLTVPLTDAVTFQPEALYVMKGTTLAAATQYELTVDARYLEIPLLFRLGRSSGRAYVLAGPSVAFRLSAEARETVNGATETRDFKDQIKGVDLGIAFGAGVAFNRFLLEGRWSEGLRDVESQDQFDTAVRHRVLAVLAGFRF